MEISKVPPILPTQWKMCVWYKAGILRVLRSAREQFSIHPQTEVRVFLALIIWSGLQKAFPILPNTRSTTRHLRRRRNVMHSYYLYLPMTVNVHETTAEAVDYSAHGSSMIFNTARPRHNGRQLADYISNWFSCLRIALFCFIFHLALLQMCQHWFS